MISKSNKVVFTLLVVFLLSFSFISALEYEIKEEFAQEETILAKVSGRFVDSISSKDISLYQDNVRVAFIASVKKINEDYYIFGQGVTKEAGNYSLRIQGIRYIVSGETKSDDIIIPFKVSNEVADFTANPLVVVTSEKFTIELSNKVDKRIEVKSSLGKLTSTTSLTYDETKQIEFSLATQEESSISEITLKSENTEYKIIAFKIAPQSIPGIVADQGGVSIQQEKIERYAYIEEGIKPGVFVIINPWEVELNNIEISVSDSLKDYVSIINKTVSLEPESEKSIIFEVNPGTEEKNVTGEIIVETSSSETFLPVFLGIFQAYQGDTQNSGEKYQDCNQVFAGTTCKSNEECIGEVRDPTENPICCLGECKTKEGEPLDTDKASKIVGWVLTLSLVLIGVWFFLKKYKGASRPIDLLKIGKGKANTKASLGKLEKAEKIGLEKEFEDNDLPSAIKNSLDSLSKKKK